MKNDDRMDIAKRLYDIGIRIEKLLKKDGLPGKFRMRSVDTNKQSIDVYMRGDEEDVHNRADELVLKEFGPSNIMVKVFPIDHEDDFNSEYSAIHVYCLRRMLANAIELPDEDEYEVVNGPLNESSNDPISIPLGLNADPNMTSLANPNANPDVGPLTILEDLKGQLSDGMWENTPAMNKYWLFMDFKDVNGELCLVFPNSSGTYWMDKFVGNGFLNNLDGNATKIRTWLANHLKFLVQDEVGKDKWDRDNEQPLSYFNDGTTVAMVYAVYDILKGRPARGKSIYYDAYIA